MTLNDVPLPAGQEVEVTITSADPAPSADPFPLRGKQPYRFDDPFGPAVPPEEWDTLR